MTHTTIMRVLRMLGLLLVQILILNNVHVAGYITPFIIGYMLIRFHTGSSRVGLLLWGFSIGLLSDVFSNTAGMASAACTVLGMAQPKILRFFQPVDSDEGFNPSIRTLGIWKYTTYCLLCMTVVHTIFYLLDAFSLENFPLTLAAIAGSTAIATILCIVLDLLANRHY